ncbi:hypothetical protein QWY84_10070 [Aquisalimonas lutea]|uniref:hypothetical protein n=1 Tax=Aquisalimonas lutea TaxID=1327750 RepID=UPI0025B355A5|nr:hypothetical protein [Aquisalimonas lutea]MDN3517957.1 hypothetical protein [Aquisalimonas lutea]
MTDSTDRPDSLRALMERRDCTDPAQGDHPMQTLVERLDGGNPGRPRRTLRTPPLVAGRDGWQLRHSTTETVLAALADVLAEASPGLVVRCPGLVCGGRQPGATALTGHQLDYWVLGETDSIALAGLVRPTMAAALPGCPYRLLPSAGSGPVAGFRIDIGLDGAWREVGDCGVLHHDGAPIAVGFRLALEPLLAASGLGDDLQEAGTTETVTSSRS